MKKVVLNFLDAETKPDDEFDTLISSYMQLSPPEHMVTTIMQAVQQLPRPEALSQWKDFDFLGVELNDLFCS
jgi:hypothetical protein